MALIIFFLYRLYYRSDETQSKLEHTQNDAPIDLTLSPIEPKVQKVIPSYYLEVESQTPPFEALPVEVPLVEVKSQPPLIEEDCYSLPGIDILDIPENFGISESIEANQPSTLWNWNSFLDKVSSTCGNNPRDNSISYFDIGQNYSCLVGGGIGSGKSTLLHNIICNTAANYSPSEVELLLLDFKEGTEFTIYDQLPHVKVLVTASDISLGLSSLEFVDKEIKRRGLLFKKSGHKDFKEYRNADAGLMPRWLVVIDEFQTLFYDHLIARQAEPLLDNLVRKGRAFGINFILSTQSLLGVNIAESTLSQLGTRIALRMPERDASRFLAHDNTVPASFTVPGMAVYNDNNGFVDANKIIQTFPIEKEYIQYVVKTSAIKYPCKDDRFILDGAAFVKLPLNQTKESITSDKINQILFRPGVPLDLSGKPAILKFNKKLPERLCVLGYDESKWDAVLRSWVCQFSQSVNNAKITIFDFSEELNNIELPLPNLDLEIISDHIEIENKIKALTESFEITQTTSDEVNHMLCFFDIGSARVLRRKNIDLITKQEIENPIKSQVIQLINFGPSAKFQITVFSKRSIQIEESLKKEYDTPVRADHFDYQIITEANESRDSNAQSLSEHNAYVVDNVLGENRKVILYNCEE
ncbi:MAG: FtsK/SpoIIIE domain-containing protein [Methylotenera sp.]